MPKSKQSKHKAPSGDPYPSRKSGDNENTVEAIVEVESSLHCDKCIKEVERLVQCEKCQVWFCTGCGKIGENIMSLLVVISDYFRKLHVLNTLHSSVVK